MEQNRMTPPHGMRVIQLIYPRKSTLLRASQHRFHINKGILNIRRGSGTYVPLLRYFDRRLIHQVVQIGTRSNPSGLSARCGVNFHNLAQRFFLRNGRRRESPSRPLTAGRPTATFRSNLPAAESPGSRISTRFVAAMTNDALIDSPKTIHHKPG